MNSRSAFANDPSLCAGVRTCVDRCKTAQGGQYAGNEQCGGMGVGLAGSCTPSREK